MGLFNLSGNKINPIQISQLPPLVPNSLNTKFDELITNLFMHDRQSEEFKKNYSILIQSLYQCPYFYIALSRNEYDKQSKTSPPVILTKDNGQPTFYIFSSLEIGVQWCEHYENYNEDGYLLGLLTKTDNDFRMIYSDTYAIGVQRFMLNETGRYINMAILDMIEENNIPKYNLPNYWEIQLPKFRIIERKK